jgi:monofunctional biosynthetic peptidoglycan transglycosylase
VNPSEPSRLRRILIWAAWGTAAATAAFAAYIGVLVYTTPDVEQLKRAQAVRASVILSSDGEVIGRFSTAYQAPVPLKDVSPDLVNALIATEDKRFYEHHGLDPVRIVGSAWGILQGRWQGGSTITQQLAKNLFLGGERSLARKGQEFVVTAFLEALLSKDRILEIYLNSVEWGEGVFCAEAAARRYFHTGAGSLSAAQAARLAVLLPAPKRFEKRPASPYVLGRAATIMARMGAVDVP